MLSPETFGAIFIKHLWENLKLRENCLMLTVFENCFQIIGKKQTLVKLKEI